MNVSYLEIFNAATVRLADVRERLSRVRRIVRTSSEREIIISNLTRRGEIVKIAVAGIIQETCSFSPVKTTLRNFKISLGDEVVLSADAGGVIGGFLSAMEHSGCSFTGTLNAQAMSGGSLSSSTLLSLRKKLLKGLGKVRGFDAVFISLHGAMASDDEPDACGLILEDVRKLVGSRCFVAVELDHHANVTRRMVSAADVIAGYEKQPHDLAASGAKMARVMSDILKCGRKPHASLVKIPMLAPQDNFLTSSGPMKEWFSLAREMEKDGEVIVASTFPTQPWLDAPDNGWSCLVYADSPEKARRCAEQLAAKAWRMRREFWRSERLPLSKTIAAANSEPKGLVVISDTGDAVLGGAPGDNMSIIAEMLKHELNGTALVPVVAPDAFAKALAAGAGSKITLSLGGRMSAGFSPRLKISGTVRAFAGAGDFMFDDGRRRPKGRSALFEHGNLKIAILELRDYSINHPSLYQNLGVDVEKAQMVVLKTGSNFQYFKEYQSRLIRADSPGPTQSDLTAFKWEKRSRPLYPFDGIKNWRP
jgi:microcystin degradation protein MlrC